MAVLAFGLIGAAIGSSAGMASLGFTIGSLVGSLVMGLTQKNAADVVQDGGGRIQDNIVQTSAYGAYIPIMYGLYRCAGNVIWASPIREVTEKVLVGTAGKGGLLGQKKQKIYEEKRYYYVSFAIAYGDIGEHRLEDILLTTTSESEDGGDEIDIAERKEYVGIRRMWFNSELMIDQTSNRDDLDSKFDVAVYLGGDDAQPDPTIVSHVGVGNTPAYRGTLYMVVTDLELTEFGGAIPTITAEVYERLDRADNLEEGVEGICRDPGGDVWVCSHTMRVVQRINKDSLAVKGRIGRDTAPADQYLGDLPAHPWRIAASPFGDFIWVTHKGKAVITRINRADHTWVSFPTAKMGTDITVDSSGNVWVCFPYENVVRKYNNAGGLLASVTVADAPWTCKYDPQRNAIWCGGNRKVHKILVATNALTSTSTGRFFHSEPGFSTFNTDVMFAGSGDDVAVMIKATDVSVRRLRALGTYPTSVDVAIEDPWSTYYVSTYAGNRVRAYSRSLRGQFNAGTISFPGPLVAFPDGTVFVSNTKLGIVQKIRTR